MILSYFETPGAQVISLFDMVFVHLQSSIYLPLKLTFSHLKTDGWKTFSFPFGFRPIFTVHHQNHHVSMRKGQLCRILRSVAVGKSCISLSNLHDLRGSTAKSVFSCQDLSVVLKLIINIYKMLGVAFST